jgi:carboxyl-terminal processing protease
VWASAFKKEQFREDSVMPWRRWGFVLFLVSCVLMGASGLRAADDEDDDEDDDDKAAQSEPADDPAKPASKEEQYFELMRVFADTFEQIERNYVKDVDRRKLVEAALRGMMEELDPYSNYISPDDLARFNVQVEQEFSGIGIQVTIDAHSKRLTVTSPLPGTPAYKAGVKAGDTIMEINGKTTEKMTIDDAVKVLKGKEGDEVTVGVLHQGSSQIEQLKMPRAKIHVATVQGDSYTTDGKWNFMIDPERKIGYVRLSAFSRNTAAELKKALNELKAQGMLGLVLDLRFNPGGLLTSAVEVADLFIEEGKIVSTKGRNQEERVQYAKKAGTFSGFPMAVLVNRYSASASEIVSAALQDHKRAVVVGERTWGKGSVQNVIELESGKSALKLTTASYHRPSGKNIHRFPDSKDSDEWGVMPDENYLIPFTIPEMQTYLDFRKQRDVLSKEGPPKTDYVDKQLARAEEYVIEQLSADKSDSTAKAEAAKPPEKAPEKAPEKSPEKKPDAKQEGAKSDGDKQDSKDEARLREPLHRLRALPRQMVAWPTLAA